jgi:uncharacterized protein YmfQ (DUF2313 family)
MDLRNVYVALLAGNLTLPVCAYAAESVSEDAGRGSAQVSDRERMQTWSDEKARLEKSLRVGEGEDFYRRQLEQLGYRITAVNQHSRDHIEYEIVKAPNTYEVQIDLDKATGAAKEVNVTANMWRAESTEKALKDENYKVDYSSATDAPSTSYSDRARMKTWTSEKERLEKALKANQAKAYYPQALRDLGYQVTAVNNDEPDYVEYEVVKGQDSYEVQIDLDKDTGKATKIDVTANMWQADATDKALARRKQ